MKNDGITEKDRQKAESEFDVLAGVGSYNKLPTRQRNSLARDQMNDWEYSELCDAIRSATT